MDTHDDLTGNRALIYRLFREQAAPLSAYDVLERLKPEGIKSPPVVYRALKFLEQQGLIHRIESRNAYIACPHGHAHAPGLLLVCESCGRVEEASDPVLGERLERMAHANGFRASMAPLELKGICKNCLAA